MRVLLVDLARLHASIRDEIDAAIARVVSSGQLVLGPEVDALERELARELDVPFAVAVSSGSDALLCALWAEGVGKAEGDEVITPALTFVATAEAIVRAGAKPVFVDVDEDLNIDPSAVRAHETKHTRAVIAVDLFGRRARVQELGGTVIEDAAQAIGAKGVGNGVRAAAVSFFPTKNLGALGDGGLLLTEHRELAKIARELRVHGSSQKYIHERIGWNMRLDAIQAAVLRVKLPHLRAWNAARARIAARYLDGLANTDGLTLPRQGDAQVWHQFVVRIVGRNRDAFQDALASQGIETAVYYPLALHLQPAFSYLGGREGQCPVAERATREVLALPIHPMLQDDEVDCVIKNVRTELARSLKG